MNVFCTCSGDWVVLALWRDLVVKKHSLGGRFIVNRSKNSRLPLSKVIKDKDTSVSFAG